MSDSVRGAISAMTAGAIWGGLYVVSDVVLEEVPPFTLLSLRLLLGVTVLLLMLRQNQNRNKAIRLPQGRARWHAIGVGLVGFGISLGAQFVGTDLSTAVNGALITSAAPAFIVLFAALILREKLTLQRIAAVILATIGVVIIVNPAEADFGSDTFAGDIALAVAAVSWGLYSVLVRAVSKDVDTLALTILGFVGSLSIVLPAAGIELTQNSLGSIDAGIILGVLYLGVISTAVAIWLWNRAFALIDASAASLFFFAQPVVGAGLGVVLLNQPLTLNLLAGGALIAGGVLLSMLAPARTSTSGNIHTEAV